MPGRAVPQRRDRGAAVEAFFAWFQWLYDETGINLTYFYDSFDRARMIGGFFMTIWLSLVCLFFSTIIGVVGACLQGSRFVWTRRIVQGYIQLFRNTPPLVQMYFFFFALGNLLPRVKN